ncbi:MAG: SH3 domain-containing protein [Prevotella sp.]|nr:SH3 domain-containing protein [Prevotella sp.]
MKKNVIFTLIVLLAILTSCEINIGNAGKKDADTGQTDEKETVVENKQETTATEAEPVRESSVAQPKVLPEDLQYGRVSDPDGYTNVRKEPTTKAPIVRRYQSGEYLYYFPLKNGWSLVYSGAKTSTFMGYMSTSRIVRVNPESGSQPTASSFRSGYITDPADSYVNIRKGPGTSYAITGRLDVGTFVYYQPAASGWVKVYNDDKYFLGYVARNRID